MRRLSLLVLVLGLTLLGTGAAAADPPARVDGPVTDDAGVLAPGDDVRIVAALDRLRAANGAQLFVVYVDSFDGAGGQRWADDAAELSQLGVDDVLLAVAVADRAYGVSVADGFSESDSTVDGAVAAAEARLADDDYAGAAIALADALDGGVDLPLGALLLGGVGVAGAAGAYLVSRRRRAQPASPSAPTPPVPAPPRDEFTDVPTDDLAYRASAGLIEVDEAVRTSEVELSAARGHFGDEAVAGFAVAVEASRADMLRAFGIRQLLDDDVPEDEPATRAMLADIVRACRAADERLDAQVEAFDRLRDLEATAPQYLAGLGTRRQTVVARVPQTEATWAALRSRYSPHAVAPIAGHIDQARRLLDTAGTELDAAGTELAAGRAAAAVVSGRAAEDALTQAETLLDGVPRRETELADAAAAVPAARAETEQDLAEARALTTLAPVVARAEAALGAAADVETADPIAALRLIDDAGAALDIGIADARAAQDRARRAGAVLDQTLLTARSSVAAAADFVTTRRGAVGAQARTRLAEAQRHLQLASSGGDPAAALSEAQRADALGQEALRLAQSDVSGWSPSTGGSSVGVDLASLILGGIISGATHGGFGGGGYGSGGSRGGASRGGRSAGSFGGSSSRGRRGGGGRF